MLGVLLLIVALLCYYRKYYYSSLLIFFLFLTGGFQLIPSLWLMWGLPFDKATDLAILFTLLVTLKDFRRTFSGFKHIRLLQNIKYLLVFVTVSAVFSYLVLTYPIVNIIQVYRQYLFFF